MTVQCDVCEPITAVQITPVTTTPIAGDSVGFEVNVLPETAVSPYTYTVSISGTAVITAQNSGSNPFFFDHTFADPGVYTVTVAVWNCDLVSPLTSSVNVTVLPPTDRYKIYLPTVRANQAAAPPT